MAVFDHLDRINRARAAAAAALDATGENLRPDDAARVAELRHELDRNYGIAELRIGAGGVFDRDGTAQTFEAFADLVIEEAVRIRARNSTPGPEETPDDSDATGEPQAVPVPLPFLFPVDLGTGNPLVALAVFAGLVFGGLR